MSAALGDLLEEELATRVGHEYVNHSEVCLPFEYLAPSNISDYVVIRVDLVEHHVQV
jgi:hypothetical protein